MRDQRNVDEYPVGPLIAHWREPSRPAREPLVGRFCRLEPLQVEAHAAQLFAANQLDVQGNNWTYLAYGPFPNFDDYRRWLEQQSRSTDPLFFAIIELRSGEALGVASYMRITPASGSIEVGHLHYSTRLQRTPAATEAMVLMMAHAFELGYRRYEWKCDALNRPSRMAAARLGFSFEGIFRQATIVKGRNRDTAWHAVIDQDWPRLRAAFEQWLADDNFDETGRQRVRLSSLTAPLLHKAEPFDSQSVLSSEV